MKKIIKKVLGVTLAIVFAFATVIGVFPTVSPEPVLSYAEEKETQAEAGDSVAEMMNPTSVPDQYERVNDPYGKKGAFNLAPQNELAKIFVGGGRDSTNNDIILTEQFETGSTTVNDYSNAGEVIKRYDGLMDKWSYIQAVGFDPNKTGRDTHIAYIGYEPNSQEFRLNVINAVTGKKAKSHKFIAKASWLAEADGDWLMQFNVSNYLSIVAGDFDNDERETVVVYAAADVKYSFEDGFSILRPWIEESKLGEYYFSESANTIYHQASSNSLLHWSYFDYGMGAMVIDGTGSKLAADLTVGDFDGDNIDDLAVVSYIGKASPEIKGNHYLTNYKDLFAPYIGIALGRGGGSFIVNKTSNNSEGSLAKGDEAMVAPSIASGDIDGDGKDEILVAGYGIERTQDGEDYKVTSSNTVNIIGFKVTANGGVTNRSEFLYKRYWAESQFSLYNKMTQDLVKNVNEAYGSNKDKDEPLYEMFPQFALECVATNGQNGPEDIFLNGTFASYKGGELYYKYDAPFFQKDDNKGKNMDVEFSYLSNLTVGVFDENPVGREQIAYTVYQKDSAGDIYGAGDSTDDYSIMVGISGGRGYNDVDSKGNSARSYDQVHTFGEVTMYDTSGLDDTKDGYNDSETTQEFYNTGIDYKDTKNLLFVSLDIDNDGVNVKYDSKSFAYTNPSVTTVLQAAPYYGEFGYLDDGATSYTFTTSYTIGQSTEETSSMSIGAKIELQAVCVKTSISTGYSEAWTDSSTSAFSEEYSTTFTATREHLVVMQRTPVINYLYLVQDSNGNYSSNNYISIAVPCEPVYTLLSVDEYNAYVTSSSYTSAITDSNQRLKAISESMLPGKSGVPSSYKSDFTTGDTNLSASLYEASSSSGHITSSYSSGNEETIEQSTTSGFYFDSDIMVGGGAFNVEAWGGVSMSTTNDRTQGQYETTATSTSVAGTVSNLGESGFPKHMLDGYAFNWKFGCWPLDLGVNDVYAYGYVVSGAQQKVVKVDGISAKPGETENESILLTWEDIAGASGYNVYLYDNILGAYNKLTTAGESSYLYEIDEEEGQSNFSFSVTAIVNGTESIYSNLKTYYRKSYGMSAYDLAVENGFEGTVEEWLVSLVGENGHDGVGVSNFYFNVENELIAEFTDGSVLNLGEISGEDGENGLTPYIDGNGNWWIGETDMGVKAVGVDGITPQIRINEVTNEWEVSVDNGVTWVTTGVKATGADGTQGVQGVQGIQGEKGEDGANGLTPFIGENGNWWIGEKDTGVAATVIVESNDGGCRSSIADTSIGVMSMLGVMVIFLNKKKEQ